MKHAQDAGAIGVLLYWPGWVAPDDFTIGSATLPAVSIGYADAQSILAKLKVNSAAVATLNLARDPEPVNPDTIANFSSRGPDAG